MIEICVENTCCWIFNIEDWKILRSKYRIIGEILGNNFCIPSLPLKLLPEEALLLNRKGIAKLVKYSKFNLNPAVFDKQLYNEFKENLLNQQKGIYEKIRKQQIEYIMDKIVSGKRRKGDQRCKEEIFAEELIKSSSINYDTMLWPIFCHHINTDQPTEVSEDILLNQTTVTKLTTFMDLWERGYFITPGNKFGGDFLLYLGDPILHHAVNIVHCVSEKMDYNLSELIALSRLGTSVKKRTLLATLKNNETISYITLNWINT